MNIETVRDYCLGLPLVTEDFPFDETTLTFRLLGKIFAVVDLDRPQWLTLKCDPERAIELREEPRLKAHGTGTKSTGTR